MHTSRTTTGSIENSAPPVVRLTAAHAQTLERLTQNGVSGLSVCHVLIVGSGQRAVAFARSLLARPRRGGKSVHLLGFLDPDPGHNGGESIAGRPLGLLADLPEVVAAHPVDEVLFVVPRRLLPQIEAALAYCDRIGLKTRVAVDLFSHAIARMTVEHVAGWPFISFNPPPHSKLQLGIKRAIDITLAAWVLLLTAPLFVLIALAIKLSSTGPLLFRQQRCTMSGRRFRMLKFRTMVPNAELIKPLLQTFNEVPGPVFKIRRDPRVTPLGRWLRKYSLDELPQLINVLLGDMSIVGARPPLPSEVQRYDQWQRRRLSMRTGITGLWQVRGRNAVDFDEWMRLDLEYIDSWSLALDLKILLRTLPTVLRGTGH